MLRSSYNDDDLFVNLQTASFHKLILCTGLFRHDTLWIIPSQFVDSRRFLKYYTSTIFSFFTSIVLFPLFILVNETGLIKSRSISTSRYINMSYQRPDGSKDLWEKYLFRFALLEVFFSHSQ